MNPSDSPKLTLSGLKKFIKHAPPGRIEFRDGKGLLIGALEWGQGYYYVDNVPDYLVKKP